jgi:SMC interacting uncharacterized protein involved in chromosome segregation
MADRGLRSFVAVAGASRFDIIEETSMSQEFTFAQALTEAKQIIVQQASRIKSDADKLKVQSEMLMAQGATVSEQERTIKDQSVEIERLTADMDALNVKLSEAITAKEQADNIINRQGEKITSLQSASAELEKKVSEQSEQIHSLERERESLVERLPTQEDADALAAMSALLMKKVAHATPAKPQQMRLADAA